MSASSAASRMYWSSCREAAPICGPGCQWCRGQRTHSSQQHRPRAPQPPPALNRPLPSSAPSLEPTNPALQPTGQSNVFSLPSGSLTVILYEAAATREAPRGLAGAEAPLPAVLHSAPPALPLYPWCRVAGSPRRAAGGLLGADSAGVAMGLTLGQGCWRGGECCRG